MSVTQMMTTVQVVEMSYLSKTTPTWMIGLNNGYSKALTIADECCSNFLVKSNVSFNSLR